MTAVTGRDRTKRTWTPHWAFDDERGKEREREKDIELLFLEKKFTYFWYLLFRIVSCISVQIRTPTHIHTEREREREAVIYVQYGQPTTIKRKRKKKQDKHKGFSRERECFEFFTKKKGKKEEKKWNRRESGDGVGEAFLRQDSWRYTGKCFPPFLSISPFSVAKSCSRYRDVCYWVIHQREGRKRAHL